MEEIWKDIEGYEGLYQVSNTGKVRSFHVCRNKHNASGYLLTVTPVKGYCSVSLSQGSRAKGIKRFMIHRLVAQAFIPNPNGYTEVNHKDEDKTNNNVDNLEWCTRAYNMAYKNARLRQGISCSTPVEQLTLDNIHLATYASIPIAARINNIDSSDIHKCCKNKQEFAYGYKWQYCKQNN